MLNRLASVTQGSTITGYTFDASGNRETQTVTTGASTTVSIYANNELNRLTGLTKKVNNIVVESMVYGYDNIGNQQTVTKTPYTSGVPGVGAVVASNTYDVFNQLKSTTAAGSTTTNTYNPEGLRLTKAVNGASTKYLYEFDKVVLELDGSGNQIAKNVYGTNLLNRTVGGETLSYLYNGHADVTAWWMLRGL